MIVALDCDHFGIELNIRVLFQVGGRHIGLEMVESQTFKIPLNVITSG